MKLVHNEFLDQDLDALFYQSGGVLRQGVGDPVEYACPSNSYQLIDKNVFKFVQGRIWHVQNTVQLQIEYESNFFVDFL